MTIARAQSLLIIATLLWASIGVSSQVGGAREVVLTLPDDQLFSNTGRLVVAISPDASALVYVANGRLYLQTPERPQATAIDGTPQGAIVNPVFSPDGRWLAFWAGFDQTIKRVPVTGGAAETICAAMIPFGLSWGPGEQIVFGQGAAGIMRVAAGGGTPERIVPAGDGDLLHGPQLLPGGDAVLFTVAAATQTNWDEAQIVVQSLRTGARTTVVTGGSDGRLAPGGRLVYAAGGRLFAAPFDVARQQVTGPAVQIVDGVMTAGSATGTSHFALAADGSIAYVPRPFNPVALVALDGTRTPVGQLPATTFAPRVSPDGRKVVYDSDSKVWVADLSNLAAARPFTPADSINNFPMWSADGQHVVFTSNREGGVQGVYWQRADGTDDAELLVRPARAAESWSPDGERVTFLTQSQADSYDVWWYSMRDRNAAPLIAAPKTAQMGSRFSPDGQWIAYESDESGRLEIYVEPLPRTGARYQVTKDGGSRPMWSPDGRQLYFDRGQRLFVVDIRMQDGFSAGEPVALPIAGFIQGPLRRQYDVTPDGKEFLMMFRGPLEVRVTRLPRTSVR